MSVYAQEALTPNARVTDSPAVALLTCAIMCALFWMGHDFLVAQVRPHLDALQRPADAPAIWWDVAIMFTRSGPAEIVAAFLPVWLYCLIRGHRFADLGFSRAGTPVAWIVVLALQGLLFAIEMRGPIGTVGDRFNTYALYSSFMIATTAAFSEELFFRGFLIEVLRRGGFSNVIQVVISSLLFGAVHLTYIPRDVYGWTIPIGTAILGLFWGAIYIWGKRSLWPVIAAHFVNDFVVLPAAFYLMLSHPS
ncbi:MAG: CPBP family intramembrane metalloprotease [Alphaproteobacteria bacterium]|nr:CPBP family intramembrane metalloprotease [Alphaproteobacteria bacterium]